MAAVLLSSCSGDDDGAYPRFTSAPNTADGGGLTDGVDDADVAGTVDGADEVDAAVEPDDAGQQDRPASLTETGWVGSSVRCNYGDRWVYAAQGDPGKVVICVDDDELYVVDTGTPYAGDTGYAATSAVCPVSGTARDRYVWHHADTGWTEYDGTALYIMDIFSGRGEMDLTDVDNLVEDSYDGAWTNPDVEIPTLRWCQSGSESPTANLLQN